MRSTRPATTYPTRFISSRFDCRSSCAWRCSTECCRRIDSQLSSRPSERRTSAANPELAPVRWTVDGLASGFVVRDHFVLLSGPILLFGPRRSHSSVPARINRRLARAAAVKDGHLWPPEGLVLDGREHDGILMRAGIGRLPVFVIDRREIADRGMAPTTIVEAFDESEHRHTRLGLVLEPVAGQQLALKRGEEAFAHGVVVGVSNRAHRGPHTRFPAALPELDGGVLRALVGVMDHAVRTAHGERHVERIQYQPRDKPGAHRPA